MLYSRTIHALGGSGFFIDGDKNAPSDAISVSNSSANAAINAPRGSTYSFDSTGTLTITPQTNAQVLSAAIAVKQIDIKNSCSAAIVGGVVSNALGSDHTYPTTRDDQANLNGLITESLLPASGDIYKFWCADVGGVWGRRIHTKLQVQDVGKAVADHVKFQQEKYEQKLSEIAAADEVSLVAIVW